MANRDKKLMLSIMMSTLMTGCGAFGIECQIKDPSISLHPGDHDNAQTSENEKEPVKKAVQQDGVED